MDLPSNPTWASRETWNLPKLISLLKALELQSHIFMLKIQMVKFFPLPFAVESSIWYYPVIT